MITGARLGASDTIVAIATSTGRSALAVLRVSGADTRRIATALLQPWPIPERRPTLCEMKSADGAPIDRPLTTYFAAPASYTGEDLLEISTHGGLLTPVLALNALIAAGAREALPGEFTRRAVLNGKIDVLQAEAIADLIDARSSAHHHAAILQLDGGLSRQIQTLRDQLIELEALIGYEIDFPEEDDGPVPRAAILETSARVIEGFQQLIRTATTGEIIRDGAVVVIAGRPNTGKSSLFNALLGQARAIVTEVPGTTRDAIEVVIDVQGWPVRLVDTAGLRPTNDVVERLGIEVSERYLNGAHLVLVCADNRDEIETMLHLVEARTAAPTVTVRTKSDIALPTEIFPANAVAVSSITRHGLGDLLERIRAELETRYGSPVSDQPVVTRARHLAALKASLEEIQAFASAWSSERLPAPVIAVHLRAAITALEELIGAVDVEDVLDRIFHTFCIGK